ncbi:hypothetical protein LG52_3114 [Geobacillus kaustophilus]|uniref:Uncharacterized protein n=1 Tax=Geobacillus kaustophilus TaxID=1462 RepID=A0A0D8BVU7_GEOKU|nr:hypothetical protein [Geobacillus kaustophilus]KJE28245.1 hypothetical protein LG52_3114 [Geobacillus kaustophilus]
MVACKFFENVLEKCGAQQSREEGGVIRLFAWIYALEIILHKFCTPREFKESRFGGWWFYSHRLHFQHPNSSDRKSQNRRCDRNGGRFYFCGSLNVASMPGHFLAVNHRWLPYRLPSERCFRESRTARVRREA